MFYPENFEQKIGFSTIRENLAHLCSFAPGTEEVERMAFSDNPRSLQLMLDEAAEMCALMADDTLTLPIGNLYDMRENLRRIRVAGLFLDEAELFDLRRTLESIRLLLVFFAEADELRFPQLKAAASQVAPVEALAKQIDAALDKFGRIKDNASPELARLRREMTQAQGSVSRTLHAILRKAQADGYIDKDTTPTLREGRLVIPVSPMYKKQLGGIVHDESATGKTVFVEPAQVVEANNRIRELEGEEHREVVRILQALSDFVRPHIPDVMQAHLFLGKIDFLHAKALFSAQIGAIRPQVESQTLIEWQNAVHPLLLLSLRKQGKSTVPLTLTLNAEQRILLISGPNAGGKSVCLKTVALLQYMMQCGLPVPMAEESRMGIFSRLFIDIGDEQSIENDLSTYSSHLLNMKYFVRNSNAQTLLLIDEFGGGTEPQIGGAIAEATLDRLNQNGAFGVITTHYTNLKHFAEDAPGIVNGAMLYDRQQLQPLFQLEIGRPGSSFAVEIARKIGLPEDIIASAVDKVGAGHIDYDKHLQDIARDKRYWENKRQKIHQQEKQLEEKIARYDNELASMKAQRRENLAQAKQEAQELLRQSRAVIENTVRRIKETQADKEATRQAREQLQAYAERIMPETPKPAKPRKKEAEAPAEKAQMPLAVGGYVRLKNQNAVGQVLSFDGKKAVVAIGNIKTTVAADQLETVSRSAAKKQANILVKTTCADDDVRQRKLTFRHDIDVRGMRGDEALQAVTYFMDDAVMVGAGTVRILHGTGNGILRQLIRQYLNTVPNVASFRDEQVQFGGAGITIVELN